MNWWQIGLLVLLLLWLLGRIRLGGDVEYSAEGLRARVRFGVFHLTVFPMKKKPEEKKKPKEKKAKPPEKTKKAKRGGGLERFKRYVSLGCEAAGALKRRIRIDDLKLDLLMAGEDAYKAAMGFGHVNAVLGMLWPLLDQNFEVKSHRFRTAVDFRKPKPEIYAYAAFSARIGQLISFAIRYGIKFFMLLRAAKKPAATKKEAI